MGEPRPSLQAQLPSQNGPYQTRLPTPLHLHSSSGGSVKRGHTISPGERELSEEETQEAGNPWGMSFCFVGFLS